MVWRVLVLAFAAGCSGTHEPDPGDAGPDGDADADALPDADARIDADAMPRCGNLVVEPREQCDPGPMATAACSASCELGPRCGDGVVRDGERCDDGDRQSGDGCSAACDSDETCGNGTLDLEVGELCEPSDTRCDSTCRAIAGCGDGVLSMGERCDDGNRRWLDGCGADCRFESTSIVSHFEVMPGDMGCDLVGDSSIDNALGAGIGPVRELLNAMTQRQVDAGELGVVLAMLSLDDEAARGDADVLAALVFAKDADMDDANNFGGAGSYFPRENTVDSDLRPNATMRASVTDGVMEGGPARIPFTLAEMTIPLDATVVRATFSAGSPRTAEGLLCGAMRASDASLAPNLAELYIGGTLPACEGSADSSLLDMLIAGVGFVGVQVGPVLLDTDLDGDGLEAFELRRAVSNECAAVIVACIDGDGTRIEGRDCVRDPRIADGISAAISFGAVPVRVVPGPL